MMSEPGMNAEGEKKWKCHFYGLHSVILLYICICIYKYVSPPSLLVLQRPRQTEKEVTLK